MAKLGRYMDLHSLLYIKIGRVAVFRTYTAQSKSKYLKHKLQQNGPLQQTPPLPLKQFFAKLHTANHYVPYYMHVQQEKSLPFAFAMLSGQKKHVSHVHTTSAA